jgi:hypothetical protein
MPDSFYVAGGKASDAMLFPLAQSRSSACLPPISAGMTVLFRKALLDLYGLSRPSRPMRAKRRNLPALAAASAISLGATQTKMQGDAIDRRYFYKQ